MTDPGPTVTLPAMQFIGLIGWAAWATLLLVAKWWLCRRLHCGVEATTDQFAWEDEPPATASGPATATERAAS